MIIHENRLLADIISNLFRKLGKMSQNLSSATVAIGALRVKCQHAKLNQNILICTISMSDLFTHSQRSGVCIRSNILLACCSTLLSL